MLNVALIICPGGFFEEIIAVSNWKKKVTSYESDKNPNIFNFQRFYAFFSKFLTNFLKWNVEKGQQGKK